MASTNPNSLDNQDQFHAKVPPTHAAHAGKWHKPGNEQGNAAVPEFHAESHAPGTAPAEHSFRPNPPAAETHPQSREAGHDPLDFPGATSGDVHNASG